MKSGVRRHDKRLSAPGCGRGPGRFCLGIRTSGSGRRVPCRGSLDQRSAPKHPGTPGEPCLLATCKFSLAFAEMHLDLPGLSDLVSSAIDGFSKSQGCEQKQRESCGDYDPSDQALDDRLFGRTRTELHQFGWFTGGPLQL